MVRIYNDPPPQYSDDNLKLADSAMEQMVGLLQNLSDKTEELPKTDKEGNSECPWAEDKYAEHVELIRRVEEQLYELQQFQTIVNQIVSKHRSNLEQIKNDYNTLNTQTAQQGYSFAEMTARHHLRKAEEHKERLNHMIEWARKVLQFAKEKKFPGGNPQKQFRPPASFSGGGMALPGSMPPAPVQAEPPVRAIPDTGINDLISMGPIGGNKINF